MELMIKLVAKFLSRVPKVWSHTKPCTAALFDQADYCEYQQFRNLNGDIHDKRLEVRTSDKFKLDLVPFWDELLVM